MKLKVTLVVRVHRNSKGSRHKFTNIIGQWRYTDPDPETGEVASSIYRSIVINTSRETMSMSDFPMDSKKYPLYAVCLFVSRIKDYGTNTILRKNSTIRKYRNTSNPMLLSSICALTSVSTTKSPPSPRSRMINGSLRSLQATEKAT
jgi:hypothetical protein